MALIDSPASASAGARRGLGVRRTRYQTRISRNVADDIIAGVVLLNHVLIYSHLSMHNCMLPAWSSAEPRYHAAHLLNIEYTICHWWSYLHDVTIDTSHI